jgi:hypothetical protein
MRPTRVARAERSVGLRLGSGAPVGKRNDGHRNDDADAAVQQGARPDEAVDEEDGDDAATRPRKLLAMGCMTYSRRASDREIDVEICPGQHGRLRAIAQRGVACAGRQTPL